MFISSSHGVPGVGLDADIAMHLMGYRVAKHDHEYRNGTIAWKGDSDVLRSPEDKMLSFSEIPKFSQDPKLVAQVIKAMLAKGIVPSRQDREGGFDIVGAYNGRHVAEFVKSDDEYPFRVCRFALAALGKLEA